MAYNVSNEYKEIIYSGDAQSKVYLAFNGVELENADTYLEKITKTSRVIPNGQEYFSIENFVSQEIDMILRDIPNDYEITGQCELKIGTLVNDEYEYVPIGIFQIADKPTTDNAKTT